jgi:hypothetical protein
MLLVRADYSENLRDIKYRGWWQKIPGTHSTSGK